MAPRYSATYALYNFVFTPSKSEICSTSKRRQLGCKVTWYHVVVPLLAWQHSEGSMCTVFDDRTCTMRVIHSSYPFTKVDQHGVMSLSVVTMYRYVRCRSVPAGHSALSPPPYDFGALLTSYTQVSD